MGATNAERQRRYRAHKRDDHTLCDPSRCPDATSVTVTQPVTGVTRNTERLGPVGSRLWRELNGDRATAGQRVLTLEACRIADRLDKLDRLLSGDADNWVSLVEVKGDPDRQEVVIDKPLAEARQQATALKQIVAELRQSGTEKPATGGSVLDQLAARRAQRLANTAG